jgi:AraC-like DNA-binding protein
MSAQPEAMAPSWRWFSSDDVPARERLTVLNEAFGGSDFPCEILPASDEPLYLAGYAIALPNLFITHGVNRGVEYRRTTRHLGGNDGFMLTVTLSGRYHVDQRHTEHLLRSGEAWAALADESATASTVPGETRESLALILPRRALDGMRLDIDHLLRPPVICDEEALGLLVNYVRGLEVARAPLSPPLAERAAEHVCDLAALALRARGEAAQHARERGLPAARLRRLQDDIVRRIAAGQPIALNDTAARHGISPVYVQKLFERGGVSFSAFVLAQRLEHVRRRLRNPRFAGHSISRIVYDAGFNNLSWFNRAFRRRYGATPSDIRAAAAGPLRNLV